MLAGFALAGAAVGAAGRIVLGRLGIACRPPWGEVAGAVLSGVVGWRVTAGLLPWWWVPLLLGWLAVPLAAADLIARRLPDALTFAAYPVLGWPCSRPAGTPWPAWWCSVARTSSSGRSRRARWVAVTSSWPAAWAPCSVRWAGRDLALAAALAALGTPLLAVATRSRAAPHGPSLLAVTWLLATLHR